MHVAIWFRARYVLIALIGVAASTGPFGSPEGARAAAPRPLTVQAALTLCAHHRTPLSTVTVAGYFRAGPVLNGPIALIGGLFDRKSAPASAAASLDVLHYNHGLGLLVSNTSRLARPPTLRRIGENSRLLVTGKLGCVAWGGIRPAAIRVAPAP